MLLLTAPVSCIRCESMSKTTSSRERWPTGSGCAADHRWLQWGGACTAALNCRAATQTVLEHVGEDVTPVAVVKGNGYGHGLTVAAQVFLDSGFRELGVADLNEAITLRQVRPARGKVWVYAPPGCYTALPIVQHLSWALI